MFFQILIGDEETEKSFNMSCEDFRYSKILWLPIQHIVHQVNCMYFVEIYNGKYFKLK